MTLDSKKNSFKSKKDSFFFDSISLILDLNLKKGGYIEFQSKNIVTLVEINNWFRDLVNL